MLLKRIVISFFFFIFSIAVFGQSGWVQPGAEWSYRWVGPAGEGIVKVKYEKDTTISGKLCQTLSSYWFTRDWLNGGFYLRAHAEFEKEFLFTNKDTVFWYKEGKFNKIYVINAQVGESWKLQLDTFRNCEIAEFTVDSIYNKTYAGVSLKTYDLEFSDRSSYYLRNYIETLGNLNWLFPRDQHPHCDTTNQIDESFGAFLLCYKDDNFSWDSLGSNTWYEMTCDEFDFLNIQEISLNSLRIFPNPAVPHFEVLGLSERDILSVYNLQGQLEETTRTDNRIDMSSLPSGIYIVSITDINGNRSLHKILKQ